MDRTTGDLLPADGWTVGTHGGRPSDAASADGRLAVPPGSVVDLTVTGPLPAGYVEVDEQASVAVPVSIFARKILLRVPLERETLVDLEVLDPGGRPAQESRLLWALLPSLEQVGWRRVVEAPGRVQIRLPHRPGSVLRVLVTTPDWLPDAHARIEGAHPWSVDRDGFTPSEEPATRVRLPGVAAVDVVLPAEPSVPVRATVRLPGSGDPPLDMVFPFPPLDECLDTQAPSAEAGHASPPIDARTRMVLHVLRRDGTPASFARALLDDPSRVVWQADVEGRIGLRHVPGGAREAILVEPGMVETHVALPTGEGPPAEVVLRESVGGDLRIRVVDEGGRAVPGAGLAGGGVAAGLYLQWSDEAAGVQSFDTLADSEGRRTLRHLSAGRAWLGARWAHLCGDAQVEVVEGAVTDVEIVVRPTERTSWVGR